MPGQPIAVGDYVQWESQGVLQFPEPLRVRALSPDGDWAFVDGSTTGMPVDELTVEKRMEASESGAKKAPPSLPIPPTDTKFFEDNFSTPYGPIKIQWPAKIEAEPEDVAGWLEILSRRIVRSVAAKKDTGEKE